MSAKNFITPQYIRTCIAAALPYNGTAFILFVTNNYKEINKVLKKFKKASVFCNVLKMLTKNGRKTES